MHRQVRGKLVALGQSNSGFELLVRSLRGVERVELPLGIEIPARIGDFVEIRDGALRVLTPTLRAESSEWMDHVLDPRRQHGTKIRARAEAAIREFFLERGFQETRTPLLVPCPGMEIHIRPYEVAQEGGFLPTSPEFAMKRLLAGGLEKIFQLAPAFRYEPRSTTHHPEFTMLEWYRAYAGYEDIMRDTEELVEFLATKIHGKPSLCFQGREISVATPWPRLRVRDLFLEKAGVDLVRCPARADLERECKRLGLTTTAADTWDDLYFRIWLNVVEPALPADRAVFVLRYPPSQAALAVVDEDADGSRWAKRFELYAGGIELGNAFEELTNATEQRARFVADMKARAEIYGPEFPPSPLDEGFLHALEEGMPPSGGIAVGVDRLVMLLADEPDIAKTIWLMSAGGNRPEKAR